jgi:hypothetical protein
MDLGVAEIWYSYRIKSTLARSTKYSVFKCYICGGGIELESTCMRLWYNIGVSITQRKHHTPSFFGMSDKKWHTCSQLELDISECMDPGYICREEMISGDRPRYIGK